ncbi:MAG: hypothetical protein QUS14_14480 [Pyrinomonadaceae bacterium]|nr:hypothetical protein [Pyrinomonadaceae bacterium]
MIGSRQAAREAALSAFEKLGWNYMERPDGGFQVDIGVNLLSWGERFTISLHEPTTITIESKCILVTQCLDWGKNKANVKQFLAHFEAIENRASLKYPIEPTYLDENQKTPVERIIETEHH